MQGQGYARTGLVVDRVANKARESDTWYVGRAITITGGT